MSITLDYISIDPVTQKISIQIEREMRPIIDKYDWWTEHIYLEARDNDKRLEGSTRIQLGGYDTIEIPANEEKLMVCRDTKFIINNLTKWSAKYKVSWALSEVGQEIGKIVAGKPDIKVDEYILNTCSNVKLSPTKIKMILKKYKSRKD